MTGGIDAAGHVRSDADVFAPTSWTPTTGALKANGRAFHTSTALLDGTILLTGGKDKTGSVLNSAETYSPITGLFTLTTGSMIHPRMFHTATLMNSGQVLLSGGTDGTAAEIASAEIYDPASGSFIAAPSMSNPRVFQSAAKLNDGDILVSGGQTNAPPSSQGNSLSPVFSADIFSAPLDQFAQPQGPMLHQHIAHTSTLLPNGLVLIAGGADSNGNISNTAEFYDPPNGPGVNAAVATPTNSRATTGAPGHRVNAGGFQVTNVSNMPESISAITVHVSDPMLLSSIQLDATVSRVKDTAIARAPEASNTLTFSSPVSIPAGGIANLKLTATMAKRAKHLPLHAHTVAAVTTIVIDGPSGPLDTMGLPIILNTVTLR
jgi:WD40 repeat protein